MRAWALIACGALGLGGRSAPPRERMVAITIDDLPYATVGDRSADASDSRHADSVNRAIIAVLARRHVPVTGFVIEAQVEHLGDSAGARILKRWTDAGLDLGNHSYSHPDFDRLSVDRIEEEITRGEATIGRRRFFRFPFNHTGDTKDKHDSIAAFLARRGYRVGTCTMENDDWLFNGAYVHARMHGDSAAASRVRAAYVEYTATKIDYFASLSQEVVGYEQPEVMLLHANDLNSDMIDSVLTLFQQRHYRFVSLDVAQADPAYQIPDTIATPDGPMWQYRWARSRHVAVNGALDPEPPAWIKE